MSNEKTMYYVGFCRICGTGPLGLRECGECGAVVVLCDECDAVWDNADFAAKPRTASSGELPCPSCETSLIDAPSCWAGEETISATPWIQLALQEGNFEIQRGSAFAPDVEPEELEEEEPDD